MATAAGLGLRVDDAIVLNDSNRLVLRLMPCDVVARVAPPHYQASGQQLEVEVARLLAETNSPVARLEPRVEPRAYVHDGFVMNLWTHYEPVAPQELPPVEYARALERLHAGMRAIDVPTPHFLDRVAETQQDAASRDLTPELSDADREALANTLRTLTQSIAARGAPEQVLHGEPHPWNVIRTKDGPLFIDFENCTRGPVEYDLAWVPEEVSAPYPGVDHKLVGECRGIVLAIIAVWRWRRDDQHPSHSERAAWLSAFRQGPPWPAIDDV